MISKYAAVSGLLLLTLSLLLTGDPRPPSGGSPAVRARRPTGCGGLTFRQTDYSSGGQWPNSVTVGDFDTNGTPDLAIANYLDSTIALLSGHGDGTFGAPTLLPTGDYPNTIVSGSLRGDARLDLLTSNSNNTVSVLLGQGNGTFDRATPVPLGANAYPICAVLADFNEDGRLDLATGISGYGVDILLGNGDGTLAAPRGFPAADAAYAMAVSDVNRDDHLDLALTTFFTHNIALLLGRGDGTFAAALTIPLTAAPSSVVLADFNHDGNPDLAVPTRDSFNGSDIKILLGTGTGQFGAPTSFAAGSNPGQLVSADFNGDQHRDLAAVNQDSNDVTILLGHGDGTFTQPASFGILARPTALAAADFNGDGGIDLAVASSASLTMSILLNNCIPTVLPTATAATATRTPSGPTGTPTPLGSPTPTVCPIQFGDVPPGSPFYAAIRCLACRGIVGGYPCGGPGEPCPGPYFRPGNQVTRGQVSKIVAESAGFANAIPSTQQTFADVPPSGTFWLWVERLSGRSILGGYPCGGAFEPCIGPGNRPYFRPNNQVTRGQLSKITSGAAGWTETPTSQTFEDVPPTSPFYLWVERVASRSIVGGYPCGEPGEPCVAPGNRPYFRPVNNATRGQMSKIAAAAFFPGCTTPSRR